METVAIYLLLGAFAGTVAGLLGIGGGIIIVPALASLFTHAGFSPAVIMHLAVGTSLATITLTSLSSVYAHFRHGAVRFEILQGLAPGLVAGALGGALLVDTLASESLRIFFGLFVILVGIHLVLGILPSPHRQLPGRKGLFLAGTIFGGLSTLLGIGGGNLIVPFLVFCNVPVRNAVASAAAGGLPIATVGATGLLIAGLHHPELPAWTSGYIYWPAFVGIVSMSVLFAPLGAYLAHRLPTALLRRGFGLFLGLVGIRMLTG
jgi:hypothetical protein